MFSPSVAAEWATPITAYEGQDIYTDTSGTVTEPDGSVTEVRVTDFGASITAFTKRPNSLTFDPVEVFRADPQAKVTKCVDVITMAERSDGYEIIGNPLLRSGSDGTLAVAWLMKPWGTQATGRPNNLEVRVAVKRPGSKLFSQAIDPIPEDEVSKVPFGNPYNNILTWESAAFKTLVVESDGDVTAFWERQTYGEPSFDPWNRSKFLSVRSATLSSQDNTFGDPETVFEEELVTHRLDYSWPEIFVPNFRGFGDADSLAFRSAPTPDGGLIAAWVGVQGEILLSKKDPGGQFSDPTIAVPPLSNDPGTDVWRRSLLLNFGEDGITTLIVRDNQGTGSLRLWVATSNDGREFTSLRRVDSSFLANPYVVAYTPGPQGGGVITFESSGGAAAAIRNSGSRTFLATKAVPGASNLFIQPVIYTSRNSLLFAWRQEVTVDGEQRTQIRTSRLPIGQGSQFTPPVIVSSYPSKTLNVSMPWISGSMSEPIVSWYAVPFRYGECDLLPNLRSTRPRSSTKMSLKGMFAPQCKRILSKPRVISPASVRRGRKLTIQVIVSNKAQAKLSNLQIRVRGRGVRATKTIGSLRESEKRMVRVKIKMHKKGKVPIRVTLASRIACPKQTKFAIIVK